MMATTRARPPVRTQTTTRNTTASTATPLAVAPSAHVINVTPELARSWIERNGRNRSVRPRVVNSYARDMADGNWQLTGEAVKFDAEGNLLDGQHRLYALQQAGVTVQMLVVRGVAAEAQEVMDSGARRKPSDMFSLDGYSNATVLASAARLAAAQRDGALTGDHASRTYTHSELRDFVLANADLADAATVAAHYRKSLPDFPPSVLCVAWWQLSRIDLNAAGEFFDGLANHSTYGRGDPRNALLHRVQTARRNRESFTQATYLSLTYRAWNAWRRGAQLDKMAVKSRSGLTIPKPL